MSKKEVIMREREGEPEREKEGKKEREEKPGTVRW